MHSNRNSFARRHGKNSTPRLNYLQQLVTEFQDTKDVQAKCEILANLANFAYDSKNYDTFLKLNIIELFVDMLDEEDNEKIKEFAIGGICNCIPDKKILEVTKEIDALPLIIKCLSSPNKATVLSSLTTLYYMLLDKDLFENIKDTNVLDSVKMYKTSEDRQLSNTSMVFLSKFEILSQEKKNVTPT